MMRRRAATFHSQEYVATLRPMAPRYNGFNLLLGDPDSALCLSNRDPEPMRPIASGGVDSPSPVHC